MPVGFDERKTELKYLQADSGGGCEHAGAAASSCSGSGTAAWRCSLGGRAPIGSAVGCRPRGARHRSGLPSLLPAAAKNHSPSGSHPAAAALSVR